MTEREKLACDEMKIRKAAEQGGRCYVCGKLLGQGTQPQLAHLIKQPRVKRYSKAIIHHALNTRLVCSLFCNGKVSIGEHQAEIDELVKKIIQAKGK